MPPPRAPRRRAARRRPGALPASRGPRHRLDVPGSARHLREPRDRVVRWLSRRAGVGVGGRHHGVSVVPLPAAQAGVEHRELVLGTAAVDCGDGAGVRRARDAGGQAGPAGRAASARCSKTSTSRRRVAAPWRWWDGAVPARPWSPTSWRGSTTRPPDGSCSTARTCTTCSSAATGPRSPSCSRTCSSSMAACGPSSPTHESLLAAGATYADMVRRQMEADAAL